jgi:hypothetical protein
MMDKKDVMKTFQALTDLLIEASSYDSEFQEFATENEHDVKIACFAKSVIDGYAIHTEKMIDASEESIIKFQDFIASLDREED